MGFDHDSQRRGLMLVLSSPSGAGKTTLTRRLLKEDDTVQMSVSATTRAPRPGEVDGVDYFFVSPSDFDAMIKDDHFYEHATVFDHQYGTPRGPVDTALDGGRDVIFDIDWQGAQELAGKAKDDLVRVFILPPSIAALADRLKSRGQDSEETIARRMARAEDEISHWDAYDYVLVNDDLDETFNRLTAIVRAERLKRSRQSQLFQFVRTLQSERQRS